MPHMAQNFLLEAPICALMRFMAQMSLIGSNEAAKILNLSTSQVNRLAQNGKIPVLASIGKRNIFSLSDVEAYAVSLKKEGDNDGED